MSDLWFFDTNVLLYMYDGSNEVKRQASINLFRRSIDANTFTISTQVVQEFYVAATRKLRLDRATAHTIITSLCEMRVVTMQPKHLLFAVELEDRYGTSYWDAMILAAANLVGARVVYTEDLNHGQTYAGVEVHNPFRTPDSTITTA
jgi:predicted nucleic acid-binding protein